MLIRMQRVLRYPCVKRQGTEGTLPFSCQCIWSSSLIEIRIIRYQIIQSASPLLPSIMQLSDMHFFPYLSSTTKRSGLKSRCVLVIAVPKAKLYKYRNVTRQKISIQRGFMLAFMMYMSYVLWLLVSSRTCQSFLYKGCIYRRNITRLSIIKLDLF